MNVVTRAPLTFQVLTILKIYTYVCNDHNDNDKNIKLIDDKNILFLINYD